MRMYTESGAISLRRPHRRFRTRVFIYLLLLSLATSLISGGTYYSRQVKFIERDRARRAHTLLTSLATQAELGAYARDPALCDLPLRRTLSEEDVVHAAVYDLEGREILGVRMPGAPPPPPPPLDRLRPLTVDPDARPLRVGAEAYDDLWVPIVTAVHRVGGMVSPQGARREVVGLARIGLSLTPAREQLAEVLATGVYLALGLLFLGALAAVLIAGKISDPILELARGADEIGRGNLDVQIRGEGDDEVGFLADSFSRMAAQLRETMAKLAALNRNLESEVERRTDEIRRHAELTEALNAPIDAEGQDHAAPPLSQLLSRALDSLVAATGVKAAAVLVTGEEAVDFELELAAATGADAGAFGPPPDAATCQRGLPVVEANRAIIPLLFRGEPEGVVVLLADPPAPEAVEFAARAAGQLAIALSNARAYATLQHLASALKERNAALEKQRDQLREMNRLKSEFLANVSHELRTPLNAVLGYTEIIGEGVYGPVTPEQTEALDGILESGHNLLTLINQILDLSKVESGKVDLYVTDVAVHEVIHAVVSEAQALTKDRPYQVRVRIPTRLVLKTDAARLKQVLTNLVSNAIKFTEKGAVQVEMAPMADGGCTIAVRDTGIGIRREHQQLIFEEFRQVDGSSTRKYGGTGLGLAIVRRFVQLLGGTVTVQSEPGVGSTFTVRLPAEPPGEGQKSGQRRTLPPVPPQAARRS
jgi:signal transduction histidine kinase/HAMP domain-containing protein